MPAIILKKVEAIEIWAIDVATDRILAKIPVGEKPIDVVYVRV